MKIKILNLFVDDQEKALAFYTSKLGFRKKTDVTQGSYRWLTVVSPEEPDGAELVLGNVAFSPPAQTYASALKSAGQPFVMFYVDDLAKEHERLTAEGVNFTKAPMKTPGSTIAILDDTCGNLIQLTQLDAWSA